MSSNIPSTTPMNTPSPPGSLTRSHFEAIIRLDYVRTSNQSHKQNYMYIFVTLFTPDIVSLEGHMSLGSLFMYVILIINKTRGHQNAQRHTQYIHFQSILSLSLQTYRYN
ncbi:hypothetical protein GQ43DRAFT_68030 [Delitschia confertaspora ATCC 74209]|uniref:Uncharacterized protein n=1 Tax=Delitschia confertaspora ATCC 74209 TaxID=1513339 RepID=A0A9P4JK42_9PLEO|nr:hypothetical protein GQ43DRAFT_68030 [Delitschia confertaspora ATCC 74209]